MKLLVIPRDANPYQEYLYRELARLGVTVRYVGELTPSQTVNLLLLPLELAWLRLRGWRTLHLHWVFGFSFPWAGPRARWLAEAWFSLTLITCRALGTRIVWTAHNALPHGQVFADDLRARRRLVRLSTLVIAHDQQALEQLNQLGLSPRRTVVIAPGPFSPLVAHDDLRRAGTGEPPWTLLFFGNILPYKGVEDLLEAVAELEPGVQVRIVVAGSCPDEALSRHLRELAASGDGRVELRLGHIPDPEVGPLLASSDALVLPYRSVTTSSSVLLALEHGRPVLVPQLAAFRDLHGDAVLRFAGTVESLRDAVARFAAMQPEDLRRAGEAAAALAPSHTWAEAAEATYAELQSLSTESGQGFSRSAS